MTDWGVRADGRWGRQRADLMKRRIKEPCRMGAVGHCMVSQGSRPTVVPFPVARHCGHNVLKHLQTTKGSFLEPHHRPNHRTHSWRPLNS